MEQTPLTGLQTTEFIHNLDKAGLDAINAIPGFESVSKFIIENSVKQNTTGSIDTGLPVRFPC